MTSAIKTAETLGSMLRLDPIAAAFIQNTVPPAELIQLLNLEGYVAQQLAEFAQVLDKDPLACENQFPAPLPLKDA